MQKTASQLKIPMQCQILLPKNKNNTWGLEFSIYLFLTALWKLYLKYWQILINNPFLVPFLFFAFFETVQNFLNFVNLRFSETVDENFKLFGLQY